jgi:hypothetical protein
MRIPSDNIGSCSVNSITLPLVAEGHANWPVLQAPGEQARALPIPPDDFDKIAATSAKKNKCPEKGSRFGSP